LENPITNTGFLTNQTFWPNKIEKLKNREKFQNFKIIKRLIKWTAGFSKSKVFDLTKIVKFGYKAKFPNFK
jgi:hypothetical protein